MNVINKEKFYELIGSSIVSKRKELGLTQIELANKTGMSRTSIVNIENGKQYPPLHLLWAISYVLEIKPSDLLPTTSCEVFEIGTSDKSLKSSILRKAKKEDIAQESISKINSFVLGM
jgi:transcriptional regulator with XRE-family HTH domain